MLNELMKHDSMDFWTKPKMNAATDIMVGPKEIGEFTEILNMSEMKWTVKIQDVGRFNDLRYNPYRIHVRTLCEHLIHQSHS